MNSQKMRLAGAILLPALLLILVATPGLAAPKSQSVVAIGGYSFNYTGGGYLPSNVAGYTFASMTPGAVTAAALSTYDTVVLNMGSSQLQCNSNNLSATAKQAIIDFVAGGKKLIIYDSECWVGVNYSWLPFPFTTNNPGAQGARGTLTIIEDNTLSSPNVASPYYVNAAYLGNNTDAVGDMNVMVTHDPGWCLDMSGTNINHVTGPVHTYAKYPTGTDTGLIIYNGMDQDYMPTANLLKVWSLELAQPFNPSGLPCGYTVVGITLTPSSATNAIATPHSVTATLLDLVNSPQPDILVSFSVIAGPNAGTTGVCNPASCRSNAAGQVTWTYTGFGGVGTDQIKASFVNGAGETIYSNTVTKEWINPVTAVPVDVKPLYCPNPVASTEGVLPIGLLGTTGFDVTQVDMASVRLEGTIAPIRGLVKDVGTPDMPFTGKANEFDCNATGVDGVKDIFFYFDNKALFTKLGNPPSGAVLTVTITGKLLPAFGGSSFAGEDKIKVK